MRVAARHGRPFVARGSGTGLAGGATPVDDPVVIVTTQLNRVLDVDADEGVAWVEPGVLNLDLSRAVHHLGLHYAPDPSSQQACTIGGNVATNAGGPHCLASGVTVGARARHRSGAGRRLRHHARRSRARRRRLRPARLLRGQRGHHGHRHPHRGAPQPDPPAVRTLLLDFMSVDAAGATVSGIIAGGRRARGAGDDGRARSRARSRTSSARAIRATRRRCCSSSSTASRRPSTNRCAIVSDVAHEHGARDRARRRRRRRARAALEGPQVGVRRHRPHRARLLPARRGRARARSSSRCCATSTRSRPSTTSRS